MVRTTRNLHSHLLFGGYGIAEEKGEMIMDFVTFEIAKKLKEKGFPIKTKTEGKWGLTELKEEPIAPTISQVLKWFREEKKIHIELWTVGKKPIKWCHTITTLNHVGEKQGWSSGTRGDSYEAAAIAGIEYILDNLI